MASGCTGRQSEWAEPLASHPNPTMADEVRSMPVFARGRYLRGKVAWTFFGLANATRVSIPSLLTGKVLSEAVVEGEDDLLLRFSSGEIV